MPSPRYPDAAGRYIPLDMRRIVMQASLGLCFYCGDEAHTVDHVVPWSQGGSHHPMNLVAACTVCNSIAGERLFRDITDKLAYIQARRVVLFGG